MCALLSVEAQWEKGWLDRFGRLQTMEKHLFGSCSQQRLSETPKKKEGAQAHK